MGGEEKEKGQENIGGEGSRWERRRGDRSTEKGSGEGERGQKCREGEERGKKGKENRGGEWRKEEDRGQT